MPTFLTINRTRGDTYRIRITFTESNGAAVDFTNAAAVILTVDSQSGPDDSEGEVFAIEGDIVAPATSGIVDFQLSATDADHVGKFWYDVEVQDQSGYRRTILNGPYVVSQDITKTDETFDWTPNSSITDGTTYDAFDNSIAWYILNDADMVGDFTYETRDGRKVIRDGHLRNGAYDTVGWMVKGPEIPRHIFAVPGWEWKVTAYINLGLLSLEFQDGLYFQGWWMALDNRSGSIDLSSSGGTLFNSSLGYYQGFWPPTLPSTVGWPTSGWYTFGHRLNLDNTVSYMIKPEADADNWITTAANIIWNPGVTPIHAPNLWTRRKYPNDAASVVDVWKYEWRRL
jgi:hypothetical protein